MARKNGERLKKMARDVQNVIDRYVGSLERNGIDPQDAGMDPGFVLVSNLASIRDEAYEIARTDPRCQ